MAPTRLYVSNAAATFTPTTIRGTWNDSSVNTGHKLDVKAGSAADSQVSVAGSQTNYGAMTGRWVSEPLTYNVTISGTVTWILIGCYSSLGSAPSSLVTKLTIFVTAGSTDTLRGTLLSNFIGGDQFPVSTRTGYGDGAVAISTVAASSGDRIVAEVGFQTTTTAAGTAILDTTYGGTDATDRGEGDTTANRSAWVEFSTDLTVPSSALPPPPTNRARLVRASCF